MFYFEEFEWGTFELHRNDDGTCKAIYRGNDGIRFINDYSGMDEALRCNRLLMRR